MKNNSILLSTFFMKYKKSIFFKKIWVKLYLTTNPK